MMTIMKILACRVNHLTWIIHGPRFLQMRGMTHAAMVVHRKWVITKQMQQDRFARGVKNADELKKFLMTRFFSNAGITS
jgi:hypothetical protein